MFKRNLLASVVFSLSLTAAPLVLAGPAGTMAMIVTNLAHHPSDADQAALKAIVSDPHASAAEKTIATAIAGINHSVSDGDKAKLMAIAKDASAPADLKELATVLLGVNHMASDADKAKLKNIK